MTDIACTNSECPEHESPRTNPAELPLDMIVCGRCGGPVQEVPPAAAPEDDRDMG